MNLLIAVDIVAASERVWNVMTDVENWSAWTASVLSIRRLDTGPLRFGSRAVIRQPRFPPALWTVTALDPGRSFSWRSGLPGLWVYANHSVEPVSDGTRATLTLHYEGLLGSVIGRLTRGTTDRYLALEAAGLKQLSEALERS